MSLAFMDPAELTELVERPGRVVDSGLSAHPAVDIIADDQIRPMRLGSLDLDPALADDFNDTNAGPITGIAPRP